MASKEQHREPRTTAFNLLSPTELQTFFWHFHELEISHGCGGRPCKMCCYAAPHIQDSHLPFSAIQDIHSMKAKYAPHAPYWLYRANDPIYYADSTDRGIVDLADVVQDAHNKGLKPTVSTHGFMPGEVIAERAAAKLVRMALDDKAAPRVHFSIDSLGFIGLSQQEQREVIAYSLELLEPIVEGIYAFFIPEDQGSMSALEELLQSAVPHQLQDVIHRRPILGFGRAIQQTGMRESRLVTQPSSLGYTIRHTGSVEFNAYTDAVPREVGNIFHTIQTPLETPAPDAPSFGEFDF